MCLPSGINLDDISWSPTREEILLEHLRVMQAQWMAEDFARFHRYAAELTVVVAKDRLWLEQVNEIQREQKRVNDYWLAEQKKTAEAIHAAQLKKLELILEDIQKDNARAERAELLRRNVVRGRRSNVR
jgi:hypothetical protein